MVWLLILAWQLMPALVVHHHVVVHLVMGWAAAATFLQVVDPLWLHPMLVNALWASLRRALLIVTANGMPILHLHLEHATLLFSDRGATNILQTAGRLRDDMLRVRGAHARV